MRLLRTGDPRKSLILMPRHIGYTAINMPITAQRSKVGDALPTGWNRATTTFGRRGMLRIGKGRRRTGQTLEPQARAEQIVAIAMVGDTDIATYKIGRFHGTLRRSRRCRAAGNGRCDQKDQPGAGLFFHPGTIT